MIRFLINLPNIHLIDPTYRWKLIDSDPDDDKFVDCAIASGADYIITNDKHFEILKSIPFPKVAILNADEYIKKFQA